MVGPPRPGGTGLPCHGTDFNNSVSLNTFASKAATSAVFVGHSSNDLEFVIDRTFRASISSNSAERKLINAFSFFPRNSGRGRTVARKFSIEGLCNSAGGLDIIKLTKTPLIYSVSRFNLGGLELCLGGISPPKPPRGDGTGEREPHKWIGLGPRISKIWPCLWSLLNLSHNSSAPVVRKQERYQCMSAVFFIRKCCAVQQSEVLAL